MYNPTNNPLQGIDLLDGEQTVQGQIKARTIALKSCIEGRNNSIAEGIPDRIFISMAGIRLRVGQPAVGRSALCM